MWYIKKPFDFALKLGIWLTYVIDMFSDVDEVSVLCCTKTKDIANLHYWYEKVHYLYNNINLH